MNLSPQSQEVIDRLKRGEELESPGVSVGPFDSMSIEFLSVFVAEYDNLAAHSGTPQASALRDAWLAQQERDADEQEEFDVDGFSMVSDVDSISEPDDSTPVDPDPEVIPSKWRLLTMRCMSIRGVAPPGEEFEFEFEGQSNLIFGPNGSGKSSLLGAVLWVFTGEILRDSDDDSSDAPMYDIPSGASKGKELRKWPVAITLPKGSDFRTTDPSGWAELQLQSADTGVILHLRRHYGAELEVSDDGDHWRSCSSLTEFGIESLDIQLSLVSPTIFGRQAIEVARNTRSLLGRILGYDDLERLGELATNISRNRTRLANIEKQSIAEQWDELRQSLRLLPGRLPDDEPCKTYIDTVAAISSPQATDIDAVNSKLKSAIGNAEKSLAETLGLELGEDSPPDGLGEKLITAVSALEKGIWHCFSSFEQIRLETALPGTEETDSPALLIALDKRLRLFLADAKDRISKRFVWWQKETAPGSKSALLLRASQDYDPKSLQCPVCDQSIKHLPLKEELASLKRFDVELTKEVATFFRDLEDKLQEIIPTSLSVVAKTPIGTRILNDWTHLQEDVFGPTLKAITDSYEILVQNIVKQLTPIDPVIPNVLPDDADAEFLGLSVSFAEQIAIACQTIGILQWSRQHADVTADGLAKVVTSVETGVPSLSSMLLKGKQAAAAIKPLRIIQSELQKVLATRKAIAKAEAQLDVLEQLVVLLDQMKLLSKFAASEVTSVFGTIKDKTIEYWNTLYPERSTGMKPGRLTMGKGRDKSIEALLSHGEYEIPGQYFANAGLQRAIALSFYFALLEEHPHGLDLILMDDPILSLDEDHRELWSNNILRPKLDEFQIILATHQSQYLRNCRCDFESECVVRLNPRDQNRRISCHPGDRLRRAESEITSNWETATLTMRKYTEDVLITLDAYSPEPFFDRSNLKHSLDSYATFTEPHPLAGTRQRKIVGTFRDPKVSKVLNPSVHSLTESDVTRPMAKNCLKELLNREGAVRKELNHLEELRVHSLRGLAVPAALIRFESESLRASWSEAFSLRTVGRAAARMGPWTVDLSEDSTQVLVPPGSAVLVASDSLDPVAKSGQWVLLEAEDVEPNDGDLVAARDSDGNRYLRRVWSDGERWVLHAINPVRPTACIISPKRETAVRRITGVVYHPLATPSFAARNDRIAEWEPSEVLRCETIQNCSAVDVEGDSLTPIARQGQKVLVREGRPPCDLVIPSGSLAVVETLDDNIGNVIKRVFPDQDNWILASCNPVDTVSPLNIPTAQISRVWPIYGVLFEFGDEPVGSA